MSCNSIYSIHLTFYSSLLSSIITSSLLWVVGWLGFILDSVLLFNIFILFIFILCFIYFTILWINDLIIENSFSFTSTEQSALVYGIKIMILSEWMLFMACFWGLINFSLVMNTLYLYPLMCLAEFGIPFSNLIVLVYSSLSIQSSIVFYKIGFFINSIEQLSQTISCGIVFLILQINEFLYSYVSISDSMIGSIFYFTTGLHGAHVFFGLIAYWIVLACWMNIYGWPTIDTWYASPYYIEFNVSMFFASYYWHFVDMIWFLVYVMYFVFLTMWHIIWNILF